MSGAKLALLLVNEIRLVHRKEQCYVYISGVYAHGKVSLSDVERRYIVKKGGGWNGGGGTSVGGECGDGGGGSLGSGGGGISTSQSDSKDGVARCGGAELQCRFSRGLVRLFGQQLRFALRNHRLFSIN
ncbi:hypothetical protein K0M31_005702 [Melipona bicolor]|uniref:Uncharacterized protein n=1 Tax=Melipona bicolor TaxID=60889 RepID=A0AA40FU37_9HYME|nr:hypothetical protein K0M31_005702 [Melipona bicolor]